MTKFERMLAKMGWSEIALDVDKHRVYVRLEGKRRWWCVASEGAWRLKAKESPPSPPSNGTTERPSVIEVLQGWAPLPGGPLWLLERRIRDIIQKTAGVTVPGPSEPTADDLRVLVDKMSESMVRMCEPLQKGIGPQERAEAAKALQQLRSEAKDAMRLLALPLREKPVARRQAAKDLPS